MGNNEHTIVYLIGMGPGNSDCLTREAVQALSQQSHSAHGSAIFHTERIGKFFAKHLITATDAKNRTSCRMCL